MKSRPDIVISDNPLGDEQLFATKILSNEQQFAAKILAKRIKQKEIKDQQREAQKQKIEVDQANSKKLLITQILDYTSTILGTPKDIFNQAALTIKQVAKKFDHLSALAIIFSSLKQAINFILNPTKIVSILFENNKFQAVKFIKAASQFVSAVISTFKWLVKLSLKVGGHVIPIVSFVKSIAGLVPQVIDLVFVIYNRFKEKNEENRVIDEARKENDNAYILANNRSAEEKQLADLKLEAVIRSRWEVQAASRAQYKEKLSVALHKCFVGIMFIVGGIIMFTPASPVGLVILTAMSFYISIYKTTDTLQSLPPKVKPEDVPPGTVVQPPASKRRIPLLVIMAASAAVAIGLAILTGGVGAIICLVALALISVAVVYASKRKTSLSLAAIKATAATQVDNAEEKKQRMSQGAEMMRELMQGEPQAEVAPGAQVELVPIPAPPVEQPKPPTRKLSSTTLTPNHHAKDIFDSPPLSSCKSGYVV